MNIYNLSRHFWNYSFENPEKIKPQHSAIYFYAIEVCNRLGWKEKFGFPSAAAMEATGIKSHNTFTKRLNELVDMGLIKMIEKSKNQYTANVIALSKFAKAHDKALDRHCIKHLTGTVQSTDSINKPINNSTNTQIHKKCKYQFSDLWDDYDLGGRAKGSKKQAEGYWRELTAEQKEAAVELRDMYLKQAIGKDGKVYGKQVKYYLRDREWEGVSKSEKKVEIPEKYQKDIERALPYCKDWGISEEVKLWTSPDRDEPFVTLGGLSVWYFRSYATEYAQALEYYKDKELIAEEWERKIAEGLRETRGDTNKMTEL